MSTIDISKKCPHRTSLGPCEDDQHIEADKGDLQGTSYYGYVTHSSIGKKIGKLTCGGKPLLIEDSKGTTTFSTKYPKLEKVTTYYYKKNDSSDHIHVPLILRVNGGEAYHLYLNKGGDHTKWREISLRDLNGIPSDNKTTPKLTSKLNSQTCTLHRLHKIDIRNDGNSGNNPYTCHVCKEATLWSSTEKGVNSIDYYKRFCHVLLDNGNEITHPVAYGNDLIRYRENANNKWKPLSFSKSNCEYLSVYYWEGDSDRENPLLMEVKHDGQSTWYENGWEAGMKRHDKWTKLEDAINLFSPEKLKEKLNLLSCLLNGTVRISLGLTSNCHTFQDTRHKSRILSSYDSTIDIQLSLSAYVYTPSKDSGSSSFNVSEFYLEGHKQTFPGDTSFFKDVTKVTAYASSCDTTKPFLLCIETESSNEKYKWYQKTKPGNDWEVYGQFSTQSPDSAKDKFGPIFSDAVKTLSIKPCEKRYPPSGLKINIIKQPTGDHLATTYVDSGSGEIPIAVVKRLDSPVRGFFKVTHTARTATGSFKLDGKFTNGDGIRGVEQLIDSISVFYWNSNDHTPILLEIKDQQGTKYYSLWEDNVRNQKNWARRNGYENLTSADLEDMLDDQNCHRNNAIPIELTKPNYLKPFYSKIKKNTGINPHLSKRLVSSSTSLPTPLPGTNYTVQEYIINGHGTRISRVTYNGEDTDIDPPKESISRIRIYKWSKDLKNIPLLLEFIPSSGSSTFFESTDVTSFIWKPIDGNESKDYYKGVDKTPQKTLTEVLTKKLDEVSCRIHHTVKIDISKNSGRYCHSKCTYKRIKVEREDTLFEEYIGYEHTSNTKDKTFTITSMMKRNIEQKVDPNIEFPLRNVELVTVYFPNCSLITPVVIYIKYKENGQNNTKWLESDGEKNWKDISQQIPGDDTKITEFLNGVTSGLGLCTKSSRPTYAQPHNSIDVSYDLGGSVSGDEDDFESNSGYSDEEDATIPSALTPDVPPKDTPVTTSEEPALAAQASGPIPGGSSEGSILDNPYIITSSVLGTSALACFAGWKLYNRSRGDPWVRQI
ncbi:hypothetical protein BEWA_022190 [Theileria equi strain WA]|uniref:Uncharacterized protein n=1 Tax=Theileria equi strain WA TaxID=1537102 RepID=L0AWG4_THEEQ|nr:hypothetical protein BEWA_022190 [Theileria equi strain WA]AFZ79371.1 hypothetical protein BEWA_022190 [Theileria equi strain WA]|eukprot:XP_004829037.1 hypothetical protein BEWA_022190 [Theileria equi strain WA]